MVAFVAFGVLLILGGIVAFIVAKSAIHEILGTLGIGFGLLICCLGAIATQLEAVIAQLKEMQRALFIVSHPEVRWPTLPADQIVHDEWLDGKHWRMRADGRWEREEKRGRWVPHVPESRPAGRV